MLTNLDSQSGRRHNLLSAAADLAPNRTREIEALIADLTANRESPLMTAAFQAWFRSAPGFRALLRNWLNGLGPLTYLTTDDVADKPQWEDEQMHRLTYYRGEAGGRVFYFTVGFTRDGKVGRFELH